MARRPSLVLSLDESSFPQATSTVKLTESGTFTVGDFFKINQSGFSFPSTVKSESEISESSDEPCDGILSASASKRKLSHTVKFESLQSSAAFSESSKINPESLRSKLDFSKQSVDELSDGAHEVSFFALDDLKVVSNLGQGASGVVQRVFHAASEKEFALKVVNIPMDHDEKKVEHLISELQTLFYSSCESIIRFFGAYYKEGAIYLILELMDGGSLSDLLKLVHVIPEQFIAVIARQVLLGLDYLHCDRRVIHRDSADLIALCSAASQLFFSVKPSNILLSKSGQCKLADFGVSGHMGANDGKRSFVGTVTYMSPERIQGLQHSYTSDIWSLGLLLAECALGHFPYDNVPPPSTTDSAPSTPSGSRDPTPTHATHATTTTSAFSLPSVQPLQQLLQPILSSQSLESDSPLSPSGAAVGSIASLSSSRQPGLHVIPHVTPHVTPRRPPLSFWLIMDNIVSSPAPRLPPTRFSAELVAFVDACLQKDPAARPTAAALLAHPFLAPLTPASTCATTSSSASSTATSSTSFTTADARATLSSNVDCDRRAAFGAFITRAMTDASSTLSTATTLSSILSSTPLASLSLDTAVPSPVTTPSSTLSLNARASHVRVTPPALVPVPARVFRFEPPPALPSTAQSSTSTTSLLSSMVPMSPMSQRPSASSTFGATSFSNAPAEERPLDALRRNSMDESDRKCDRYSKRAKNMTNER